MKTIAIDLTEEQWACVQSLADERKLPAHEVAAGLIAIGMAHVLNAKIQNSLKDKNRVDLRREEG